MARIRIQVEVSGSQPDGSKTWIDNRMFSFKNVISITQLKLKNGTTCQFTLSPTVLIANTTGSGPPAIQESSGLLSHHSPDLYIQYESNSPTFAPSGLTWLLPAAALPFTGCASLFNTLPFTNMISSPGCMRNYSHCKVLSISKLYRCSRWSLGMKNCVQHFTGHVITNPYMSLNRQ